jgi:hypothetical protein
MFNLQNIEKYTDKLKLNKKNEAQTAPHQKYKLKNPLINDV